VDVEDAAGEGVEERPRVDAVVAGVDDELDAVLQEEVPHGGVALLGGGEGPLGQLAKWNPALPRQLGPAA